MGVDKGLLDILCKFELAVIKEIFHPINWWRKLEGMDMSDPRWSLTQKQFALLISVSVFLVTLVSCGGNPSSSPQASQSNPVIQANVTPVSKKYNFDNLPEGVPSDWQLLYASFDPKGEQNAPTKAGVKDNHFIIDNQGTYSGQYALFTGEASFSDVQFSVDILPDGQTPIGVFLVCRYSEKGWYQFRISVGGTSIQRVLPSNNTFTATILKEGQDRCPWQLQGCIWNVYEGQP